MPSGYLDIFDSQCSRLSRLKGPTRHSHRDGHTDIHVPQTRLFCLVIRNRDASSCRTMSYHRGRSRAPNDPFATFSEVSQPSPINSGIACIPRHAQSHLARPTNYTPARTRASSVSAAEETGSIAASATASSRPGSRSSRMSMLPRPSTGGSSLSPSPVPSVSPQIPAQSFPSSISTPDITTPSAYVIAVQTGPGKRPRKVLRRKAATIGRNVEQSQPQKLNQVIPQPPPPIEMKDPRWPTFSEAQRDASLPSVQRYLDKPQKVTTEAPTINGPAELASLRTTIDTQNLPPPPTPSFPSASTPSTRYSESPGIWSRGSTPTSLSSYSPGIVQTSKISRLRQPSPSTRLPVFTPPTAYPSPQSASGDRSGPLVPKSALPKRSTRSSPSVDAEDQTQTRHKSTRTPIQGRPLSPPARKSSVNFSPPDKSPESKDSHVNVEKARKEVAEAERELFNSQRSLTTVPGVPKTPPRPSRDGTHRLDLETSPVIQSNLPYLRSTGHTRRESAERIRAAGWPHPTPNPTAATSMDSVQTTDLSPIPSREARSPVLARKSPKTLTRELPKDEINQKQTPASSKRFAFFPKKSKSDADSAPNDKVRPARKGPAAGTGHEGYGRYAQRGRKPSASSTGTRTRSTSTTRSTSRSISSSKGSVSSQPELDLDDFLSSRLEPVIISGGGLDGAALSRTQSEQSMSGLSVASSRPTQLASSTAQSTESLATSIGISTEAEFQIRARSTEDSPPEKSLATTDHTRPPKSRMPVPKGKGGGNYANPNAAVTATPFSGQKPKDASSSSNQQSTSTSHDEQTKKAKTSRWNLFQKSRPTEPKGKPPSAPAPNPPTQTARLHAAISPVPHSRQVAHYALVDAESDELEDILNRIEDSPPTEEEEPIVLPAVPAGLNIKKRQPSILLPSPPKLHGEFKEERASPRTAMFNRNMMDAEPQSSREDRRAGRLASVGRIPQVISRRDRQHRPDMQSFSRPFSVTASSSVPAPVFPALDDPNGHAAVGNSPGQQYVDLPTQSMDWKSGLAPALTGSETVSALNFLAGPYSSNEFLHFSPRKDSVSSSSSGALAAVTALVPPPGTTPTEDEVWDEYDDLIDNVLSPEEPEPENDGDSEQDGRFELATTASRALQDGLNTESPRPGASNPAGDMNRDSSDSVRLRRSRIVSALHSSIAPSTQPSYDDLIASYGRNPDECLNSPKHATKPALDPIQEQQSTFLQSLATAPAPKAKQNCGRKVTPYPSERDWDSVTRTNMRSASLMTSRWLSFGRVLFSPAHNHVKAGSHGRILVIDGLGNDDWSFYCSLTYPDAEVYSLSGRPVSTASPHPAAWQPPTNHHTVYHAGLQNPLPFPKDYFTVAVLRFPAASSGHVQSNIIQECKRVLRSGGYLEMSLLDRDMVNMGVRTRKAVRRLKEMTCLANSDISLKPTSDSIQRLIGTQGFDNLRRCMVRIPVAGMVVRSSDSTTSSSNRSLSATATTPSTAFSLPTISVTTTTGSQATQTAGKSSPSDDNVSLGDLLSDPSPSAANDESIAKIVARVGRWWYTKCYEDPVLPDTGDCDPSMWNDRRVLRECQKRGTGFRMLIAYAQKPSEVKRRTASV